MNYSPDALPAEAMRVVVLGLSVTSSWGNGHATTYRALLRQLARRGHSVLFLERDVPWYASNRDMPDPPFCAVGLYGSLEELRDHYARHVRQADLVIVGSYVPDGIDVGRWVLRTARGICAFYDIDTPVTLAALRRGDCRYLSAEQVAKYALYLSFSGGPVLAELETRWRSPCARPLYCSVDTELYRPRTAVRQWSMGYLGTYSPDRQPMLDRLMLEPARRRPADWFVVAGPQYPAGTPWPANVQHLDHVPPSEHAAFYNAQELTLSVTRADMTAVGFSPSVRLFEAAACETPILSDVWPGLEQFFEPGRDILLAQSTDDAIAALALPDRQKRRIARNGRRRVLEAHTAEHRAAELEQFVTEATERSRMPMVSVASGMQEAPAVGA